MRWYIICFVFIFFLVINVEALAQITGRVITGKATQTVGINISVIVPVPNLTIHSPKNHTYPFNESLLLNFTSNNPQTIWFNLDNGANTTITSFTFFNTSEGSHMLYLFANSSNGTLVRENVTFSVNTTFFRVLFEEYKGAFKSNSTDFRFYSYQDMQNLSSIILESMQYGKIIFDVGINLTNISSNILDLDSFTNVSSNRIELNSTALPNFNVNSTLALYNLSFTNPRILRNNEVCSSSICKQNSYVNGILNFNVTGFTIYSAEETSVQSSPAPSGGGGGGITEGGGGITFTVEPKEISIVLIPGEKEEREIKVKNTGKTNLTIDINITGISDIARLNTNQITLEESEEKSVLLTIIPNGNTTYAGKVIFTSRGLKKEVLVLVNTKDKNALFDLSLIIPDRYRVISRGENVRAFISMFQVGAPMEVDVITNYLIKDFEGSALYSESETFSVYEARSYTREFSTARLHPGDYIAGIEIIYPEGFATSSALFTILEEPEKTTLTFIILAMITIITIMYAIFKYRVWRKK